MCIFVMSDKVITSTFWQVLDHVDTFEQRTWVELGTPAVCFTINRLLIDYTQTTNRLQKSVTFPVYMGVRLIVRRPVRRRLI